MNDRCWVGSMMHHSDVSLVIKSNLTLFFCLAPCQSTIVGQSVECFLSILVFIFIKYINSYAKNLVSFIPMWFLATCCKICFYNRKEIIILLPFMTMASIIASSLIIGQ